MATFEDNINTINNAVYGKEMRPAISEALQQSWDAVKIMMGAVDQLNTKVDSLPDSGGDSGGGGSGGTGGGTTVDFGTLDCPILTVKGLVSPLESCGVSST